MTFCHLPGNNCRRYRRTAGLRTGYFTVPPLVGTHPRGTEPEAYTSVYKWSGIVTLVHRSLHLYWYSVFAFPKHLTCQRATAPCVLAPTRPAPTWVMNPLKG